jgi:glycosyltransferase involved in cell wall biosynthesis
MLRVSSEATEPEQLSSDSCLKILHVVAPAAYGGLERVVELLAGGHRQLGHDVTVAVVHDPDRPPEAFMSSLSDRSVRLEPVPIRGRSYSRERGLIDAICEDIQPDVMHTHGYRPDVLLAAVARRRRIPHVTTVHGFTGGDWRNRLYEWLQTRSYRRFARVVAVSRRLGEALARDGVPAERISVLPNAWDELTPPLGRAEAREALGLQGEGFRLGWVGRVSPEKGADVFVDALEQLGDLPLAASIVGDGPQLDKLRRRATASGSSERIRWHGAVPGAGRLFRAFDAFVLSSRTEGTPIALFEAIAAGVPVVATAVGGVPDVVTPREALLVPPDDPNALAAAIRQLRSDPAGAQARADAAAARLTDMYAIEPWLASYLAIYRDVCPQDRALEPCPL